ncbi:hypothetical protein I3760_10G153600 [Carya illinoinensis]|nr:hypothetical protein I3760_10G153600 [Carya illinoinensis]
MVRWVRGRWRGPGGIHRAGGIRVQQRPLLSDIQDREHEVHSDDSTQPPNVGGDETVEAIANEAERVVTTEHNEALPTRKRGRGPAKDTLFERIRKFGKIPLNIKDGQRGPCCENYNIFSGRVTTIVRLHANMRYASWKQVSKEEKEELIDRVRADFILDWTQSSHRECVTNALHRKYNAFHYLLRKQYLGYSSHEAALSGGTTWVEKPIWDYLCGLWSGEPFMKMSQRNSTNRKKQRINHTSGRKPFVRVMEETNEQAPNLVAFYKEVHWSKKKGGFITNTAEQNYNLMLERMNETELDGNMDETANAVFKEVLGYRPGYATGLGHSVIPEPSPSLLNNRNYQRVVEENEKNKNEANLYKNQLEALRSDLLEFKNQFKDYEKVMNTRMSRYESRRESQHETPIDA